jgi:hypothetical protein
MKYLEDVLYVLLLPLLLPLFIALGCIALIVILIRQTYWSMRNTSAP